LVGVKRNAVAQNYKLPTNSHQRFQGYSQKQIEKEEAKNKKEQEKAKKELLHSHILKQSKATQKRMKANLKISEKRLKRRPISPKWLINLKRKRVLSQRKENKYED
tara:strand:- start:4543 stop:4860 length:318 start_codon:yes stop_codon:yes gene_type:complete